MAGDWIKMRGNLWDDPRVSRVCDLTDCGEAQAIGGLYWLWNTADQHTENGILPGLTSRQIDRKTGIQGFAAALIAIGWIVDLPEGISIVRFEEHNGASAKKRAVTAKRVANHRSSNDDVTQTALQDDDEGVSGALAREREEEEIPLPPNGGSPAPPSNPSQSGKYIPPDCPHDEIRDLYHEKLPALRRMEVWNDTRQGYLRSRWREVCADQKLTRDEGVAWWADYFGLVARSKFLTGRAKPKPGEEKPFQADLEWLIKPNNFAKVIEGKYE